MKFQGRIQNATLARLSRELNANTEKAYPLLRREFTNWGIDWQKGVSARFTGRTGPETLHRRSGRLEEETKAEVTGSSLRDLKLECRVKGVVYAPIQEYGGEIRPKNKRFLTIPTFANMTASGPRYPTARSLPGETFFLRTNAGGRDNLLLMWKQSTPAVRKSLRLGNGKAARETAVPMFLLTRRVRIPAGRFGFYKTWNGLAPIRQRGLASVARRIGAA